MSKQGTAAVCQEIPVTVCGDGKNEVLDGLKSYWGVRSESYSVRMWRR